MTSFLFLSSLNSTSESLKIYTNKSDLNVDFENLSLFVGIVDASISA